MKNKHKSLLERDFEKVLKRSKLPIQYEKDKFPYIRKSSYTPDWKIDDNTYLETKGEFTAAQRSNLLYFLEQYPYIKIIMVFACADNKIHKKSKTTYGEWCESNGVEYIDLDASYNQKTRTYNLPDKITI